MKTYAIKHTAGLTLNDLYNYLHRGGHIVTYGYCVSILAFTYRLVSSPHFIKPGEKISKYRLSYNIRSLLFGWWGLPWGPIYTIDMIKINAKNGGGMDVTTEILMKIKQKYDDDYNSKIFEEDITIDYEDAELRR
ncbi:hypothetical protein BDD43_2523 [Mucilaginibacter gracilis]|uniref:Uncharacterized protein n=1 Tax=Mucilaginibacter gracilis TaxID=423350 RepID=A0A495J092_9SPHI|nr:hypothetical protein [Mucilaginibacter gracilis]RKR82347.1 hypothetical protein BDD43_2523 [Mucilaginibacter gracilis]